MMLDPPPPGGLPGGVSETMTSMLAAELSARTGRPVTVYAAAVPVCGGGPVEVTGDGRSVRPLGGDPSRLAGVACHDAEAAQFVAVAAPDGDEAACPCGQARPHLRAEACGPAFWLGEAQPPPAAGAATSTQGQPDCGVAVPLAQLPPPPSWDAWTDPPAPGPDALEASRRYTAGRARPALAYPGCPDGRHHLTEGRCDRCGLSITGIRFGAAAATAVFDGDVTAENCVVHDSQADAARFRAWFAMLARFIPARDPAGWACGSCERGHDIPPGGTDCARCGLTIGGGTAAERDFLACWLRQPRPEPPGAPPAGEPPGFRGGRIPPAALADTGWYAVLTGQCRCAGCRLARTADPPAAALQLQPDPDRELDAEQIAHAGACGDAPIDEVIAAQQRRPAPLGTLSGDTPLLVAAEPGPDYWAWRHVAVGVWIGQPGETHAGLPAGDPAAAQEMTAAQLRTLLAGRGWQPPPAEPEPDPAADEAMLAAISEHCQRGRAGPGRAGTAGRAGRSSS